MVPAVTVLAIFVGVQVFNGMLSLVDPAYGGNVGWWAHIGGFASGAALAALAPRRSGVGPASGRPTIGRRRRSTQRRLARRDHGVPGGRQAVLASLWRGLHDGRRSSRLRVVCAGHSAWPAFSGDLTSFSAREVAAMLP